MEEAIEMVLERHDFLPNSEVKVGLVAGYRSVPEDDGTTIRAYAAFVLCDTERGDGSCYVEHVDCNSLRVFKDQPYRDLNVENAMRKIASLVADLIQQPKRKKGEL